MLNIILHNDIHEASAKNSKIVVLNDAFFDFFILDKININDNMKSILKKIDNVKYAQDYRVTSKFQDNVLIRMEEISTGCKTALNVFTFPDKIFFADECGENALQTIFNFKSGNIILTELILPLKFNNTIQVISKEHKKIINNNSELEDELLDFFCEG